MGRRPRQSLPTRSLVWRALRGAVGEDDRRGRADRLPWTARGWRRRSSAVGHGSIPVFAASTTTILPPPRSASNGRLAWLGIVAPASSDAAAETERCLALGASGIGELNADAQGVDIAQIGAPGGRGRRAGRCRSAAPSPCVGAGRSSLSGQRHRYAGSTLELSGRESRFASRPGALGRRAAVLRADAGSCRR